VLAVGAAGCDKPIEVRADVKLNEPGYVVIWLRADKGAQIRVRDQTVRGEGPDTWPSLRFPALAFPAGAVTVPVDATLGARKGHLDLTFHRPPVPATVQMGTPAGEPSFPCAGPFCQGMLLRSADDTIQLQVKGAPGTVVEIEQQKVTLDGEKPATVKIELAKHVPDALDELAKDGWIDVPVKVTTDSTASDVLRLSSRAVAASLEGRILAAAGSPINLGGGDAAPVRGSLLFVKRDRTVVHLGGGSKLADVDRVAVVSPVKRKLPACSYMGSGGFTGLDHAAVDDEIVVYDRRTGKERAKRTFAAVKRDCPASIKTEVQTIAGVPVSTTTAAPPVLDVPDDAAELAWLRTQAR
jgi:hypothetical protein